MTAKLDLIEGLNSPNQNITDPVAHLVGEGRKFANVEGLAKGKLESDAFIEQLQREKRDVMKALEEAEAKLTTQHTLDDVIKAVGRPREDDSTANQTKNITPEDVSKLVAQETQRIIDGDRKTTSRKQNREQVNTAILGKYSDPATAAKFIADRAHALGLTAQQVTELSETTPTAFVAMLGLESRQTYTPPSTSRQGANTESVANQNNFTGDRKLSFYQAERRKMGTANFYKNIPLQNQMQADIRKQGSTFNDIDPINVDMYTG